MKKLLTEWRKFLKEGSEFTDLLSQVRAGEYEPLTDEVWEVIQDEGYNEELELYNPEDFEYIVLTIPPEDVEALKAFSAEALDMRIKQFFDMFRRRRDKMNAEDERETPGEYRVQYTEEELKDFFFKELRDKYIEYAKTKYPEAVGI